MFIFNDAVLRNMVIKCKEAITEASPLLKEEENSKSSRPDSREKAEEFEFEAESDEVDAAAE
jgi:small subunit ribosomal protein S6